MSKRDAIRLKARIEREQGDGPASIMLDVRGRRPTWIVGYSGDWYYHADEYRNAERYA